MTTPTLFRVRTLALAAALAGTLSACGTVGSSHTAATSGPGCAAAANALTFRGMGGRAPALPAAAAASDRACATETAMAGMMAG